METAKIRVPHGVRVRGNLATTNCEDSNRGSEWCVVVVGGAVRGEGFTVEGGAELTILVDEDNGEWVSEGHDWAMMAAGDLEEVEDGGEEWWLELEVREAYGW
ncbi:unnamed protein product [Sphenostylis stenocarpa]|uniref:Uncharacterized protein n=1 Tax=Sphenostylis stenocarpa TaxID=92480 RepID=A0AA86SXJ6_9FABA|nr:unnamed protein product [Sphenostylis stenocarpa]